MAKNRVRFKSNVVTLVHAIACGAAAVAPVGPFQAIGAESDFHVPFGNLENTTGVSIRRAIDVDGTEHPDVVYERLVKSGGVDPNRPLGALAAVGPRNPSPAGGGFTALVPQDLFLFEDTERILTTDFSDNDLYGDGGIMARGARALLEKWGDNFDFVGFFLNFDAFRLVGLAFYLGLENDVSGIGLNPFNRRIRFGVPGDNIEGFVMMWNVNSWIPGPSPAAAFTRLVLGQEFEHRWAMFLNPLLNGRSLQGDNSRCGRGAHWNFRVDGQGSGMEIPEWTGESPAIRQAGILHFNTDLGGVFSAADLYLMGFLSPDEMDARNSELRYMDISANCSSVYSGPISHFGASDIAATNGARRPTSIESQRDFRTGWIMIHLPEDPPSSLDISRALAIMEQHQIDWFYSTLGRGNMDNSIRNVLGGDFDEDGDVDINDYDSYFDCVQGPDTGPLLPGCDAFDHDADGDVDLVNYGAFMRAFDGVDCGISIIFSPLGATVCAGNIVAFEVTPDGPIFGIQWTHDGVPISGSQTIRTVGPVTPEDAGEYRASVQGQCHVAHSDIANLAIHPPAEITVQPHTIGACLNGPADISIEATGYGPLRYQWQFEGVDIPDATDPDLMLENVPTSELGTYRCLVSNGCGEVTASVETILGIAADISINRQPEGSDVCEGATIALFTGADGMATFQWFKDGEPIPGANNAFLFVLNATPEDSGFYHVEAEGACNSDVSDGAVINVIACDGSP